MTSSQHYEPLLGAEARSQFRRAARRDPPRARRARHRSSREPRVAQARRCARGVSSSSPGAGSRRRDQRTVLRARAMTFEILARQQPVAGDLRFLVAATRIVYEQERSGDLVVNCVNMLERLEGFPRFPRLHSLLTQLVEASARIFHMSVDALADDGPRLPVSDLDLRRTTRSTTSVSLFYTEIGRAPTTSASSRRSPSPESAASSSGSPTMR